MAIGINGFIVPIHLINGGFWGVSLILHYLLGFQIAITFFCLNIPIFLTSSVFDREFFLKGLLGITVSSVMIELFTPLQFMIQLPTISSIIIGGLLVGLGVGFMLKEHISPGGMDLLGLMLAKLFSINVGIAILILDSFIILLGTLTLRDERLLYSMLIVMIIGITTTIITSIKSIKLYT
jgi:uncharacterized membrane-anchored protein YitT (DUF2179 family)